MKGGLWRPHITEPSDTRGTGVEARHKRPAQRVTDKIATAGACSGTVRRTKGRGASTAAGRRESASAPSVRGGAGTGWPARPRAAHQRGRAFAPQKAQAVDCARAWAGAQKKSDPPRNCPRGAGSFVRGGNLLSHTRVQYHRRGRA